MADDQVEVQIGADVTPAVREFERMRGAFSGLQSQLSSGTAGIDQATTAFGQLRSAVTTNVDVLGNLKTVLAIGGLAAFTGGIVKLGADAFESAGRLADLAETTGVGVEALQEYEAVAVGAGVASQTLARSFEIFGRQLGQAQAGFGPLLEQLGKMDLGLLSAVRSAGSVDEALELVFDRMGGMTDATEKAALAAVLFGRSGAEMGRIATPALRQLREEARATGRVWGKDLVDGADDAGDAMARFSDIVKKNLGRGFLESAPFFEDASIAFGDFAAAAFGALSKVNKAIFETATLARQDIALKAEYGSIDVARERLAKLGEAIESIKTTGSGVFLGGEFFSPKNVVAYQVEVSKLQDLLGLVPGLLNAIPAEKRVEIVAVAETLDAVLATTKTQLAALKADPNAKIDIRMGVDPSVDETIAAVREKMRALKTDPNAKVEIKFEGPPPEDFRAALPREVLEEFDQRIADLKLEALAARIGGVRGEMEAARQKTAEWASAGGAGAEAAAAMADEFANVSLDNFQAKQFAEIGSELDGVRESAAQLGFAGPTAELDAFNARLDFLREGMNLSTADAEGLKERLAGAFAELDQGKGRQVFADLAESSRVAGETFKNAVALAGTEAERVQARIAQLSTEMEARNRSIQQLIDEGAAADDPRIQKLRDEIKALSADSDEAKEKLKGLGDAAGEGARKGVEQIEQLRGAVRNLGVDLGDFLKGTGRSLEIGADLTEFKKQLADLKAAGDTEGLRKLSADLVALAEQLPNTASAGSPFSKFLRQNANEALGLSKAADQAAASVAALERAAESAGKATRIAGFDGITIPIKATGSPEMPFTDYFRKHIPQVVDVALGGLGREITVPVSLETGAAGIDSILADLEAADVNLSRPITVPASDAPSVVVVERDPEEVESARRREDLLAEIAAGVRDTASGVHGDALPRTVRTKIDRQIREETGNRNFGLGR